jgi:hypothetical protein
LMNIAYILMHLIVLNWAHQELSINVNFIAP